MAIYLSPIPMSPYIFLSLALSATFGIGEVVSLLSIEWGVSLSQSVEARRAELLWIAETTQSLPNPRCPTPKRGVSS
jgi:hypothetical protein